MSLTTDGVVPESAAASTATPVIAVRGITKHFGSVQALRGVDLDVHHGEVVGLIGDNGAGKSTLVNILSGALQPNAGTILLDGKPVTLSSSLEARNLALIHRKIGRSGGQDRPSIREKCLPVRENGGHNTNPCPLRKALFRCAHLRTAQTGFR